MLALSALVWDPARWNRFKADSGWALVCNLYRDLANLV